MIRFSISSRMELCQESQVGRSTKTASEFSKCVSILSSSGTHRRRSVLLGESRSSGGLNASSTGAERVELFNAKKLKKTKLLVKMVSINVMFGNNPVAPSYTNNKQFKRRGYSYMADG